MEKRMRMERKMGIRMGVLGGMLRDGVGGMREWEIMGGRRGGIKGERGGREGRRDLLRGLREDLGMNV